MITMFRCYQCRPTFCCVAFPFRFSIHFLPVGRNFQNPYPLSCSRLALDNYHKASIAFWTKSTSVKLICEANLKWPSLYLRYMHHVGAMIMALGYWSVGCGSSCLPSCPLSKVLNSFCFRVNASYLTLCSDPNYAKKVSRPPSHLPKNILTNISAWSAMAKMTFDENKILFQHLFHIVSLEFHTDVKSAL